MSYPSDFELKELKDVRRAILFSVLVSIILIFSVFYVISSGLIPSVTYTNISTTDFTLNNTFQNITWNFNVSDPENDILYNHTANIYENLQPYMVLNIPFDDGNATDISGFNNNGTLIGGASINLQNGSYGKGASFDGVDDYILLNNITNSTGMTISAWYYTNNGSVYILGNTLNPQRSFLEIEPHGRILLEGDINDNNCAGNISIPVTKNIWGHVVVTLSASTCTFYHNGTQVTILDSNLNSNITFNEIGRSGISVQTSHNGSIDEVMIFNRSLTSNQIMAIYRNQSILHSDETTLNSNYSVMITTCDGTNCSAFVNTTSIFIQNNKPTIPLLNTPANNTNLSDNTPFFSWFNSTDFEVDSVNYTLQIWNNSLMTSLAYQNISIQEQGRNQTNLTLPTSLLDGTYYWRVSAFDGSLNSSWSLNRTFNIDTIPPSIFIIEPRNTTYISANRSLNFTIEGNNTLTRWYNLNLNATNITITGNTTFIANEGNNNTIYLYANDSSGNLNQSIVTFRVDTIFPSIFIETPNASVSLPSKNISIKFSVTENNTIWFNFDLGANATITGNFTALVNTGNNQLWLYANDTAGNLNYTNVNFTVVIPQPSTTGGGGGSQTISEEKQGFIEDIKEVSQDIKQKINILTATLTLLGIIFIFRGYSIKRQKLYLYNIFLGVFLLGFVFFDYIESFIIKIGGFIPWFNPIFSFVIIYVIMFLLIEFASTRTIKKTFTRK